MKCNVRCFIAIILGLVLFFVSPCSPLNAETFSSQPPHLTTIEPFSEEFGASSTDPSELSLFETIPVVVTASKKPERISQAASIMSVISAEDIVQMGARSLTDVLRTIPGFEIMTDSSGIEQIAVRGLHSETSSGVKVFIDGHSLNDPVSGGATWLYDDLPLRNVRRIEIIRGPASAIYGTNAFVSVVNIITKTAQEIDGVEVSAARGSFQTLETSFLFGKLLHEIDVTFYADYLTTEGAELFFEKDALSYYDNLTENMGLQPLSLAPGDFREAREKLSLAYTLNYREFSLRGGFLDKRREPFLPQFTEFAALNETSSEEYRHAYSQAAYHHFFTERLEFGATCYLYYFDFDISERLAPGLTVIFPDEDRFFTYPAGIRTAIQAKVYRIGAEEQINFRLFESNDLTFGVAFECWNIHDVSYRTNSANAALGISAETLLEIEEIEPATDLSETRKIFSLFAQDSWQVRNNLDLTLGARGDFFSDVGGVFTPKVGMVYEPEPSVNIKVLFGSAFRLLSFLETVDGESDNNATEELRTFEVGVSYQPIKWLLAEVNYFYTDINELIETTDGEDSGSYPIETTQIYQKVGGIDVQGVEVELRGTSEKEIGLGIIPRIMQTFFRLNYSYQDTQDSKTHEKVANMARHKANLGIGFNLSAEKRADDRFDTLGLFRKLSNVFSLYFNLFLCGERERSPDDLRDALPGYGVLDLTLTAHEVFHTGLNLSFSISNSLDESYTSPAPEFTDETWGTTLYDDFPSPGRSYLLELRYSF